ncbi:MAG: FkbM family methyltransferase [Betaproteobacteria bacterium]|nr:FkbM family methyltransferase [Betaproteobacteria bacterium]
MSVFKNLMRTVFGGEGARTESPVASFGDDALKAADAAARNGRLNEALERYKACIQANPQSLDAHLGAAAVLVDLWALDDAVAHYEHARRIAPASGAVFSALLFHRHYLLPVDAQALYDLHRTYGATTANAPQSLQPAAEIAQQRRLRIGYVSPNLSRHSVGYFIAPVIRCHDRREFEVFCYYNHALSDDATRTMREAADGWRNIAGIDDEAVSRMVRDDKIDILVDLAGHSKANRLGVFARRPAPVQMTWLGYPDTTGLAAFDFRLTDGIVDPAPQAEMRHTEKLARIDGPFLCYEPPADAPTVTARAAGAAVVFACFNNLAKVNASTLELWARILEEVPQSRLALKSAPLNFPDTVDRVIDALERCGIDPARVDLRGWASDRQQHLDAYAQADIALDTFPYNGTTTTCEALWMGVPVVTLAGEVHMSRVGASLLNSAGLGEFVAKDADDYVRIACGLAHDGERRRRLRGELRERLEGSPLLDHLGFTYQLEARCRDAWHSWCAEQRLS